MGRFQHLVAKCPHGVGTFTSVIRRDPREEDVAMVLFSLNNVQESKDFCEQAIEALTNDGPTQGHAERPTIRNAVFTQGKTITVEHIAITKYK